MASNSTYHTNYDLLVSMLAEMVISYITKNPVVHGDNQENQNNIQKGMNGGGE